MTAQREVRIARLRSADAAGAAVIEAQCMARPWPEAELRRDLTCNRNAIYLGAYAAQDAPDDVTGELVGFAGGWMQLDELHVTTLAVLPEWRRRGIGRSLMLRLIEQALDRGMVYVTLEVRVGNLTAQRLYADLGFVEVGRRPGYYADNREDALILTTPARANRAWRESLERLGRRAHPLVAPGR